METLGQFLKREREFRGISREQLGRSTRISQTILTVIEDDIPIPPHQAIYMRSFLKNYANHVGLDAGEILARFQSERGNPSASATPIATVQPPKSSSKNILILFIIAVFAGLAAYLASR